MAPKKAQSDEQLIATILSSTKIKERIETIIAESVQKGIETAMNDIYKTIEMRLDEMFNKRDENFKKMENKVADLENKAKEYEKSITDLTNQLDESNQYSRRNCLVISGLKLNENDDTDQKIIDIAAKMKIKEDKKITKKDIDRSHRMGDKVIIKFASYNARDSFYTNRKEVFEDGIFVSESLTKMRSKLLYECRQRKKLGKILASWTNDGVVKVKLLNGHNHIIKCIGDVDKLL